MKESRKFYKEKIWKVLQLEKCKKVFKWVNQVSIYRPRSSGDLALSKMSSRGFFTKKFGKNTISHDCAKWKMHRHEFCLPWAFRMFVRNQFSLFPFCAAAKTHSVSFRTIVRIFRMFMRNWKNDFPTSFCHFSHFFLLNPPPPPSIQLQSLVQVHCLFLIIHIVYSLQFHFYFVTQCFKNHLKISPQLHKTISISYKGSNVLLEHIRHNYYSKCMKLVRISI